MSGREPAASAGNHAVPGGLTVRASREPASAVGGASQAGTCRAHCEDHYCCHPARHAGLHETRASERLSTGRRSFGDLYPPGWRRDDDLSAERARRDARARELSRMSRGDLAGLRREQLSGAGERPLVGGPDVMSRDELVAAILRSEFPGEDRCHPPECSWPSGPHSARCVPGTR